MWCSREILYRVPLKRISSLVALLVLSCALGCKPATEQERFRRAVAGMRVASVEKFLDAGKDPNLVFDDGAQPIHVVAKSNFAEVEILRLLIEKGAKVDAKNREGETAWDLIWKHNKYRLREDEMSMLLALLDAGYKPSPAPIEDGRTILHEAARRVEGLRLVSMLVKQHGFKVDARDDNGWTPLHHAAFENNVEAAKGLLENGADVNAQTRKTIEKYHSRQGRKVVDWRYEVGSRALNLTRSSTRTGRQSKDVRKVLKQYGATAATVDNKTH